MSTQHSTKYGTFEIAAGGFEGPRRFDLYTSKSGTKPAMEGRFCAGPDDLSPPHAMYPSGYNAKCNLCWLNISHTEKAHTAQVSR